MPTPPPAPTLDPEYDPAVYSPIADLVDGQWVRRTWQKQAQDALADVRHLEQFRQIVLDLDRNANGRHEGDADVGDPTGISQGNPRLRTGDTVGYGIGGVPYVMPERGRRHDPAAWIGQP